MGVSVAFAGALLGGWLTGWGMLYACAAGIAVIGAIASLAFVRMPKTSATASETGEPVAA
jgi:hypothetical protein